MYLSTTNIVEEPVINQFFMLKSNLLYKFTKNVCSSKKINNMWPFFRVFYDM